MVGDFITGFVVVPLAHDLFGDRVVQRGEGVVGQLANQVLGAVDFKRIVHSGFGFGFVVVVVVVVVLVWLISAINFLYFFFTKSNIK